MKKIQVIDLFNVPYQEMSNKINQKLMEMQQQGKALIDFKVLGDSLNKCAVFIMYEEEVRPMM